MDRQNFRSINIDSAALTSQLQELHDANKGDKDVRIKITKNGRIEVRADQARGTFGRFGIVPGKVKDKSLKEQQNLTDYVLKLNPHAKKEIGGRNVITVDTALRALSVKSPQVQATEQAGNLVKGGGVDAAAHTKATLAQVTDLKLVQSLQSELSTLARSNSLPEGGQAAYKEVQIRGAQLEGVETAKQTLSTGSPKALQEASAIITQTSFSSRPKMNKTLAKEALGAATQFIKQAQQQRTENTRPPLPDNPRRSQKADVPLQSSPPPLPKHRKVTAGAQNSAPPVPPHQHKTTRPEVSVQTHTSSEEGLSSSELDHFADYYLKVSGEECNDVDAFKQQFTAKLPGYVAKSKRSMKDFKEEARELEHGGVPGDKDRGIADIAKRILNPVKMGKFDHLNAEARQILSRKHQFNPEGARYPNNVMCVEDTCIPLTLPDQSGRLASQPGMIHANKMPVAGKSTAIATQYPVTRGASAGTNIGRFWRMAIQQKTDMVVDLTQRIDIQGKRYYPEKMGETINYDGVKVTLTRAEGRSFDYRIEDTRTGETHQLNRFNVDYWVDKEPLPVGQLSDLAAYIADAGGDSTTIHCKAGVGRTSTTWAAVDLLEKVRAGQIPNNEADVEPLVDGVVMEMKKARGQAAVQTADQLQLLKDLVILWLTNGIP